MYKFPYAKSVWDAIPEGHKNNNPDLAECMFGYSHEVNGKLTALKGRVHVGHFFAADDSSSPEEDEPHKLILGTPHPSYYPLYVKDGKNWDEAVEVNGRKFYPIRSGGAIASLPEMNAVLDNDRNKLTGSAIAMCPLAAGTKFCGKIRFFNLKPFELGALVSALTLFNSGECYHSIGMGKPLGYGKISVRATRIMAISNDNPEENYDLPVDKCIGFFKNAQVEGYDYNAWECSEVKKEFTAMTSENPFVDSYMNMTTDSNTDEFRLLKEATNGRTGFSTAFPKKSISFCIKYPTAFTPPFSVMYFVTPATEACALCDEPKASHTYTSARSANSLENSSPFLVSSLPRKRVF
jgi:hypothetical protein